jgi:hypothetical protein
MSSKDKKKSKKIQDSDLDHEPTNAETSMKAKQGLGTYEKDEESALDDEDKDSTQVRNKKR